MCVAQRKYLSYQISYIFSINCVNRKCDHTQRLLENFILYAIRRSPEPKINVKHDT
jgi:hypothetical protein